MFEPMRAHGGVVEESRELYGLGIIACWMAWLAILARRRKLGTPA
jgi:hypothetical protein